MSVKDQFEDLAPDEEDLWAILSDRSGVELAEFARVDEEAPDRCFRLRPYQYTWFKDDSRYQIEQLARDLGKSLSIQLRAMAWPFGFPGQDMLITAPKGVHLRPITDAIEYWFTRSGIRLLDEMLPKLRQGRGISRQPAWSMQFENAARIITRLPGPDGQGVKGCCKKGTLINTTRGHVKIENVKVGDRVLTHLGNWKPVLATYSYPDTPCAVIKVDGQKPFRVSLSHQMLVRHDHEDEPFWATMSAIRPEDVGHLWVASPTAAAPTGARMPLMGSWCPDMEIGRRRYTVIPPEALSQPEEARLRILNEVLAVPSAEVADGRWTIQHKNTHWLRSVGDLAQTLGWTAHYGFCRLTLTPGQAVDDDLDVLWRRVEWVRADGRQFHTYDLSVDDDHSYVGSGLVHHNQHAVSIEMDESQDYPPAGYTEIIEAMKTGTPGSQWRLHGVTRGVRDNYYKFTMNEDPNLKFKVHRYMAMHRDTWDDTERQSKIAMYGGSSDEIDYQRNVLGLHGSASSPLFVVARLQMCIRMPNTADNIEYNNKIYKCIKVTDERMRAKSGGIESFFTDIPENHLDEEYLAYYAGADLGFTKDPTEILVWGLLRGEDGKDRLRTLLRVQLNRIQSPDQAAVIAYLFDFYGDRLKTMAMDRNGVGLTLVQQLIDPDSPTALPRNVRDRIKGYHPTEKVPVAFEDREMGEKEVPADMVIQRDVTSWAFDKLRLLVDTKSLELPFDREMIGEFQGQTVTTIRDPNTGVLSRRGGSKASLHTLDAAVLLVAGKELEPVRQALEAITPQADVLDVFI